MKEGPMFFQTMKLKAAFAGIAVLVVALCSVLFILPGCSSSNSAGSASAQTGESSQAIPQVNVLVTIEAPGVADFEPFNSSVAAREGATVLDITQATGIPVIAEESEYGPFVTSINGLENKGTSGWTYTLNGEQTPISAGEQEVSSGDEIVWAYIDMAEGGLSEELTEEAQ